ncbi:MAG: histidine kinase [Clostridiaceae bacterium]|nr:histidine kinase [Clostridiaceae bacterium]
MLIEKHIDGENMNSGLLTFIGIRKKLIMYFLVTILLLGVISFFSYYNARVVLRNVNSIITDYSYLNSLNNDVNSLMMELEKYLTSASSENLLNYYTHYNTLQETSRKIPRVAERNSEMLLLKDIGNMIDELLAEADDAILAKRGRISSRYISNFQRSDQISEYIKLYNNKLLDNKLKTGSEKYENINKTMNFISYFNLLIIIAALFANIYIAIVSTYRLTKPISELSRSAEKIAEGDFNIELTQTHTGDETDILAGAFIKMVSSIKAYINELKSQAEVEKRLKEQEMQNLKMMSHLKEAELKFLQSQINPHFLFNTLNAAAQLAAIEEADKSSEFIVSIADLFRYNLKNIDELTSLEDEIRYVRNYMKILKTRFGSRIDFYTDIDETTLDIMIPRIIIQPIVENAFIHGLQNLERHGEIHLNVRQEEEFILIEVEDNGIGMDSASVEGILRFEEGGNTDKNHITGIGMSNVLYRLQLFFNIEDPRKLLIIESETDRGTKVTLKLPKVINLRKEGVDTYDKTLNSR